MAHKKSQLQMQIWVNRRRSALDAAALDALPTLAALRPELDWVSPLEREDFAEYHDGAFVRAIERPDLAGPLAEFWPKGGPHWDGLAIARDPRGASLGVLLVEGKSYPAEMRSRISAGEDSRGRILERLRETREGLGVSEDHASVWSDRFYQAANRIAHLYWLNERVRLPAWMLNLCFHNDPDHSVTLEAWQRGISEAEQALGIAGGVVPHHGHAFLPAGTRAELLGPPPAGG